jgi:hypothetical protein
MVALADSEMFLETARKPVKKIAKAHHRRISERNPLPHKGSSRLFYDAAQGKIVARYYDGKLGRFIARDPLKYIDGLSMYRAYFVSILLDAFGLSTNCLEGCEEISRNTDGEEYTKNETETSRAVGHVDVQAQFKEGDSWAWARSSHSDGKDFSYEVEQDYQPYLLKCKCEKEDGTCHTQEIKYEEKVGSSRVVDEAAHKKALDEAIAAISSLLDDG